MADGTNENRILRTRWAIFALVLAAILTPRIWKFEVPATTTPIVRGVYDRIESLDEGSVVLLSTDFDPASEAELRPIAKAVLEHCFRKRLRVVALTLWGVNSVGMTIDILDDAARTHNAAYPDRPVDYGRDYAFLGYKVGGYSNVIVMGQEIAVAFPTDHAGKPLGELPLFADVRALKDIRYAVAIAAGTTIDAIWIPFGNEKYRLPLGAAATAVMATGLYPYVQSGQLTGLIAGIGGAFQYQDLMGARQEGTHQLMKSQMVVHVLILLLIVAGNIIYFRSRRRQS